MNKKVHMNIGGMTCIHCQNTIEKTLKNAKGVIKASSATTGGLPTSSMMTASPM